MFLKIVKSADKTEYVYVVESYRDDTGNIKHRYLFSLGRLQDFIASATFKRLAQYIQSDKTTSLGLDLSSLSEGEVLKYGHLVLKRIWDRYRLDEYFRSKTMRQFDVGQAVFYMASKHILEPDSKLGMYESKEKYVNMTELRLNHLYRALDEIAEAKDDIQEHVFEINKSIFNMKVDVVFYDVTTVYFESKDEDVLRKYGYSKDGKMNDVQIVLGMLVDSEGMPIGYEIFAGNTFDGKTLEPFLLKLMERFSVQRVIIVADRGINSKLNLKRLRELGYGYIVACRLKSLAEEIRQEALSEEGYRDVKVEGGEEFRYKVIDYDNIVKDEAKRNQRLQEKIVVSYSSKRARKDKHDRERLIEKAKELIESPSKIKAMSKRGGRKYLKEEAGNTTWQIDTEKIEEDKRYDGYYAIQTSEKEMKAEEIIEAYHNLWRIEETFRIMKTTLEVRPVYHWTERRIRGHFVMCFLAFLMLRALEMQMKEEGSSINKIREALNSLTVTKISIKGDVIYLRNKPEALAMKIMKKLKLSPPSKITNEKEFRV